MSTPEPQSSAIMLPPERQAPRQQLAPVSDQASLLSSLAQAAADPRTDVMKMQALLDMHARMTARDAETQFNAALADLQADLPIITKTGAIKNKAGEVQSKYALWEDINRAILPKLKEYGFSLTFRCETPTGAVIITGVLAHRAGHKTETSISLPHDTSGNKNSVQAVASSVSYGKRYTSGMLLNITSENEDDDGQAAGALELVNDDEAATLKAMLDECTPVARKGFLAFMKVAKVEDIPAGAYAVACDLIDAKRREANKAKR